MFDASSPSIPRELFTLRRSIVAFRRGVGPLREVLAQLLRKDVECIGEDAIVHLQDVFDHTLRVLDLLESQRELLTGLLEGQLAVMSNQMNQVMKATSSWGAILIVVNAHRGDLRHELPAHARAAAGYSATRSRSAHGPRDRRPLPRVQASGLVVTLRSPRGCATRAAGCVGRGGRRCWEIDHATSSSATATPAMSRPDTARPRAGCPARRTRGPRAREDQQEDADHRPEQRAAERRDRPGEDVRAPTGRRRAARASPSCGPRRGSRRRCCARSAYDENVAAAATNPHGIANRSTRVTKPGW